MTREEELKRLLVLKKIPANTLEPKQQKELDKLHELHKDFAKVNAKQMEHILQQQALLKKNTTNSMAPQPSTYYPKIEPKPVVKRKKHELELEDPRPMIKPPMPGR